MWCRGAACCALAAGQGKPCPYIPPFLRTRESRNDRQDACPTNTVASNPLLRSAGPMPLDSMWIGLEIITQMRLLVNNTAS
jgi:hypothetical protein